MLGKRALRGGVVDVQCREIRFYWYSGGWSLSFCG